MSKTAAQHDFSYSYGEEVSPELAKKVMDDVYKMVEYKKALMTLAGALTEADPILTRVEIVMIAQKALK